MGDTVVVARLASMEEAVVLKSALESANILAWLDEYHLGSIHWNYVFALGGFRLRVCASETEDAAKLLQQLFSRDFEDTSEPETSRSFWTNAKTALAVLVVSG